MQVVFYLLIWFCGLHTQVHAHTRKALARTFLLFTNLQFFIVMSNIENFVHSTYNEGMQAVKLAGNNASQQWKGYLERFVFISDNALQDLEENGQITSAQRAELVYRRKFVKLMQQETLFKKWLFKNVFLAALKRHKNEPTKGVSPYYLHQSLRKAANEVANSTEISGFEISTAIRFAALRFVGYGKIKSGAIIVSAASEEDKAQDTLSNDGYFMESCAFYDAQDTTKDDK